MDLPEYKYGKAPENLRTKKQLAEDGKRPGGPQVAWLVWGSSWRPKTAALYDAAVAKPKRQPTAAQLAALEKAQIARRTCPVCKEDTGHILDGQTCFNCAERERLTEIVQRARNLLSKDPLILDTETTGLDGFIVQIAVINSTGGVLLDTMVNPQCAISEEAQAIHGITAEMVADAPTFADLEPKLIELLSGRRVAVYNAAFDRGVICREIRRAHDLPWQADTWADKLQWRCLMQRYAAFVGEWSNYYESYKWQPLPGGDHDALGDCRAALSVLQEMADYQP